MVGMVDWLIGLIGLIGLIRLIGLIGECGIARKEFIGNKTLLRSFLNFYFRVWFHCLDVYEVRFKILNGGGRKKLRLFGEIYEQLKFTTETRITRRDTEG